MSNIDYVNDCAQIAVALAAFIAILVTLLSNRKQSQESRELLNKQLEASDKQLKKQLAASDKQLKDQIAASEAQINKQIEESRRLAAEDRQHQSRPIIVPNGEVDETVVHYTDAVTKEPKMGYIYTSEEKVDWSYPFPIKIELHNMGNGPAFNIHCVFYGSENTSQSQFISWDNGPIAEKSTLMMELKHRFELRLFHGDSVNGKHPLYDMSLDSPSNPWAYRIACLTMTYHDLFGKKYVSIFNYTLQHQWIHVITEEILGTPPLDLKELNDQKKQGPKLSAPPAKTH